MKYAALVAGAALFLTANAFSAEILSKEDFAKVQTQYQKWYHFLYRPDRSWRCACRVAEKS